VRLFGRETNLELVPLRDQILLTIEAAFNNQCEEFNDPCFLVV